MPQQPEPNALVPGTRGKLLRPQVWQGPDRHVTVAISHASNDPGRHRAFQIRASFDAEREGWQAYISSQNNNDQYGEWSSLLGVHDQVFPTPADCLGHATTVLITAFDNEPAPD
jgi:hypothetical protein